MNSPRMGRALETARHAVAVLLGGIALSACLPSAPAIENVSPFKGQGGVAGDAPVSVTFDRPMDRDSVETRFELKPSVEGCDRVACPVRWTGSTFSMTHPGHPFSNDTKYRVFIHPGYKDAGGQVNTVEHVWEFQTEAAPMLRTATPATGATGVAADADLVLQFSRPIQAPTTAQLTLRPTGSATDLNVDYHLSSASNDPGLVTVSPLRPLRPNTTYRLSISPDIEDLHHNRLGKRTDIDFTTGSGGLGRSLGFAVLDVQGRATRIAQLRPPASLNAPAPSLRVVYQAQSSIQAWGWSPDASHLYTLEGTDGTVMSVSVASGAPVRLPFRATSIAVSPASDEVAYVNADRVLHLWTAEGGDVAVPQAGAVVATPAWSGDGHRLATAIDQGAGRTGLGIVDRGTLSRYLVPQVEMAAGPMSWSFDGASLAFMRNPGPTKPAEVWIFRALAADPPALQRVDAIAATSLTWASDGGSIYAATAAGTGQGGLQRAPARPVPGQSTGFSAVRNTQGSAVFPVTPSFDRRVAFVRVADGQPQLWLVNNDGSGLTQLTSTAYDPTDQLVTYGVAMPQWAPATTGG
ncbi:MAG: Ig-like domain-containing protein [Candidatus Dormiibacterota bacterium]